MKDYIHGWNNFDLKNFGISEYHNGTLLNIEILKKLLKIPNPMKRR